MKPFYCLITALLWTSMLQGQQDHIAITQSTAEEFIIQLYDQNPLPFSQKEELFKARNSDLAENFPRLTVSGDFRGNGIHDLALTGDLSYTPNMNPHFSNTVVKLFSSTGNRMAAMGTWYNEADSLIKAEHVDFAVAGDYNMDGLDDLVLFYNDPDKETQIIYVLESAAGGFAEAKIYFSTLRDEFNFTAIDFACAGDFNGNDKPDIAVFYNYFGSDPTTKQSIFLFESDGSTLLQQGSVYAGTKSEIDFSDIRFALREDYNGDGFSDIAILREPLPGQDHELLVFEGSETGELLPVNYLSTPASELDFSHISHAVSGRFTEEPNPDILLLSKDRETGSQAVLVIEGRAGNFLAPEENKNSPLKQIPFEEITSLQKGRFTHQAIAYATTWKDDHKGAISFTFDDGTLGAFAYGAAALEEANLCGTFYVFTDTTTEYDSPVAGTELMQVYHEKGFEIASHTFNHSNLGLITAEDPDSLSAVLTRSTQELNDRFSQFTISMSIPFGSFRQNTLDSISKHFLSARSSQFGFNLSAPYDYYALRSWPILSTTSPEYVDNLVSKAETYGTYLPLMYHDIRDEPFDEENMIYSYSLNKFEECIQLTKERDVWIDTHARVYKYMREREALQIEELVPTGEDGSFSLVLNDHLPDSIYNVALTLHIDVPNWWDKYAAVYVGDSLWQLPIITNKKSNYIQFSQIPTDDIEISVSEWTPNGLSPKAINESTSSFSLSAGPNPFFHECFITIEGDATKSSQLILMNMQGSMVRSIETGGRKSIRLSGNQLPAGIYMIGLVNSQGTLAWLKILKH